MKYYFDDDEGLTKKTSHPNFVKHFNSEFYYDCLDDFSPFGNDDGADLLYNLEDWYKEVILNRNILKWMFFEIDKMGFTYESEVCSEILDLKSLQKIYNKDEYLIESMDRVIIATGFGQIKITGTVTTLLKTKVIKAFDRQILLNTNKEYLERIEKMKSDFTSF